MGLLTQVFKEVQDNINWIIGKESGLGIKIDVDSPDYPWHDLIGLIQPNLEHPSTSPALVPFRSPIWAYQYSSKDILDCTYHIPHDWLPNSDAEIHLHVGMMGTAQVGDTFAMKTTAIYGSRDGVFGDPVELEPIVYLSTGSAKDAIYGHPVVEVPLCRAVPALWGAAEHGVEGEPKELDSNDIEVDGIVMIRFVVDDLAFNMENAPVIFTADIHYQSTGIGTKNNKAPFYGEVI